MKPFILTATLAVGAIFFSTQTSHAQYIYGFGQPAYGYGGYNGFNSGFRSGGVTLSFGNGYGGYNSFGGYGNRYYGNSYNRGVYYGNNYNRGGYYGNNFYNSGYNRSGYNYGRRYR